MRVSISTVLACDFERAVAEVKTPRLLRFVAAPLVRFTPVTPERYPEIWSEGTYWVRLHLFGVVPFGQQAIVISMPSATGAFILPDGGYSALIETWDHTIRIVPDDAGVLYRDDVEIRAGFFTPFVWLFAQLFYRYRQRRWKLLVARGFGYGNA